MGRVGGPGTAKLFIYGFGGVYRPDYHRLREYCLK
jgi:hypothetical protein